MYSKYRLALKKQTSVLFFSHWRFKIRNSLASFLFIFNESKIEKQYFKNIIKCNIYYCFLLKSNLRLLLRLD